MRTGVGTAGDYDPDAELEQRTALAQSMAALRYVVERSMAVAAVITDNGEIEAYHMKAALKYTAYTLCFDSDALHAFYRDEVIEDPASLTYAIRSGYITQEESESEQEESESDYE